MTKGIRGSLVVATALSAALFGCGGAGAPAESRSVAGVALADASVSAVSLRDCSAPPQELTTTPDASGAYSFNVTGLAPPFALRAEAASGAVFAVAPQVGPADVNELTTAVVACASTTSSPDDVWSRADARQSAAGHLAAAMATLRTVLKPLLDLYQVVQIGGDDARTGPTGLRAMLHDVSFAVKSGVVTVTNRATGGVIFAAPLGDLTSGVFHAENMPAGPDASCSYSYGPWGACQADGTQTRSVASSSPPGCMGNPVLSQACSSGTTCTSFTYGSWDACQPDGTQTRTVLTSGPSGCTGGSPVLSQPCTYGAPACTSFTYSAWGACQPDGTQTRTVATSSPAGCTGGSPMLSQSCTYAAPTCTSFTYSAWGTCQPDGTQTRTVATSSPAGCTGGSPVLSQSCTYTAPPDGAALYLQSCASCHKPLATSNLKGIGISVSLIQSKGMTQGLGTTDLQAIVTAIGP